ncbi:MAG: putative permease YjgP/YjgQ family [Phormidium sp. OSCR]|nr:MAG: putative permease YjgP/YjgQ family [Phormidium sp. OSCR]
MKARDFIKPSENVVIIFTHGKHFVLYDDNTGLTGEWKLDPNRNVERVILYHREGDKNTNTLYIANHAGVEPADREGRYNLRLTHVQYVGVTSVNWVEFSEGGQNPIRYL